MIYQDNPNLTIAIGSDHAGYPLKTDLISFLDHEKVSYKDFGCYSEDRSDYPDYGVKVARSVAGHNFVAGILICGTGLGMSIVANKIRGIRAGLCNSVELAEMSRRHNDANILCLGGRIVTPEQAQEILKIWLVTPFEGGRHADRLEKINELTR